MNEWGHNPATYQAIGSVVGAAGVVAVFVSTLLAWRALRETRAQRQAIEREMAARMRPWVGLFAFTFRPSRASSGDVLVLNLRNFGQLPAQRASLSLLVRPQKLADADSDNLIRRCEEGTKVLLPGEEGNYTIRLSEYPQFAVWRAARRDVQVEGTVCYCVDGLPFKTSFQATIWFHGTDYGSDEQVRINWRNTEAV